MAGNQEIRDCTLSVLTVRLIHPVGRVGQKHTRDFPVVFHYIEGATTVKFDPSKTALSLYHYYYILSLLYHYH